MKKKKILLISSVLLTLIIIVSVVYIVNKNNTNSLVLENKEEVKTQISGFNGLSLMYETGPGTGEYQESKSSTWPEEGYIFNENLSKCENGSKLTWNEELDAVNLKTGISDKCFVYFDAYIIPIINSVSTSNITNDSITLTVNATNGNNPITTYYYSSNNGSNYVESTSNTYTFNNLKKDTEYNFSVYVKDSLGYTSEVYTLNDTTDDTILLADWVISKYGGVQGNNGIYHHQNLANSAEDGSYRYSGANPNNYVCFGSDAATCPSENLYRIIGVFGSEVKLIKATTFGNYAWERGRNNAWADSNIKNILNGTYLNSLDDNWSGKIAIHTWKVGGIDSLYRDRVPSTAYKYEVGSSSSNITDTVKIGLMYISDYGFSVDQIYWKETMTTNYGTHTNYNWIYSGADEWTISINSASSGSIICIYADGYVSINDDNYSYIIRPSFYLTSSTEYVSGFGTSTDPIRIN